jgi:deazaflavin-dependent oxidoreductase (nitroreductase family)
MNTTNEQTLRQGFKVFNRFMLILWRLGLGSWINFWPEVVGRILVLTHKGRRSGLPHQTPVNYAIVDGEIYITAGFGGIADWFRNIRANPSVEIWLPDGWYEAMAEDISTSPNRLPILRAVLIASGFAAQAFGEIDPKSISDEELAAKTSDYRLIHLDLVAPRTGKGGPGDLAWVWPLATFLLLPLALRRSNRRRRCC